MKELFARVLKQPTTIKNDSDERNVPNDEIKIENSIILKREETERELAHERGVKLERISEGDM